MESSLRIIDANLNRAREGLRVVEDVARFHLNDSALCERIKVARHALQQCVEAAGWTEFELQSARDTPGDVGTTIKVDTELTRSSMRDVAIAAGKRVGEALRSIEEAAKIRGGGGGSAGIEGLRYRVYDIEKAIVLAFGAAAHGSAAQACPQWRLCVLITEAMCKRAWWEVAREAIAAGADCIQLREKTLTDRELLGRARRLVGIASSGSGAGAGGARASVIINDRPDIAVLSGADGVHLGQDDLSVADARRIGGERLLIGVSTHSLEEARAAVGAGADVCGVGAMFLTTTKSRETSGEKYLRAYLADERLRRVPHLAIGGITPENVGELAAAGCRGVAVSSVVCGADSPGRVCERLLAAMGADGRGEA
ncbi:MAG: thiamine phosphate synthase [Phycisphaerales bacterium]|nr:thiamine phosphate synthase [Phycisphaerales bacterium]